MNDRVVIGERYLRKQALHGKLSSYLDLYRSGVRMGSRILRRIFDLLVPLIVVEVIQLHVASIPFGAHEVETTRNVVPETKKKK